MPGPLSGRPVDLSVVIEQPLTIFNGQEIVTAMTIGDYQPNWRLVVAPNMLG